MTAYLSRRAAILSAVAVLAVAGPALADGKPDPADKIFPHLDKFLKVPPGERSRVRLNYAVLRDGKAIPGLKGTFIEKGGARFPLTFNNEGFFERLPTLAQLDGGLVSFDLPDKAKVSLVMDLSPVMKPATQYEVREVNAVVGEVNTVIGKAAGALALVAPKMSGLTFPQSEAGVAVFPDGRTQPLPRTKKGSPYFRPEDFKGAVQVKLTKSPTRVRFYEGKK